MCGYLRCVRAEAGNQLPRKHAIAFKRRFFAAGKLLEFPPSFEQRFCDYARARAVCGKQQANRVQMRFPAGRAVHQRGTRAASQRARIRQQSGGKRA